MHRTTKTKNETANNEDSFHVVHHKCYTDIMCDHEQFMRRAIDLAKQTSIEEKAGGPFGCVIVKDGVIVGEGANRVIADQDPTSHGEMNAIRASCKKLDTHDLSGCTMYTSGEPCPMCYAASMWARIGSMYYATTVHDAKEHGNFDDASMFETMTKSNSERSILTQELLRSEMLEVWQEFSELSARISY